MASGQSFEEWERSLPGTKTVKISSKQIQDAIIAGNVFEGGPEGDPEEQEFLDARLEEMRQRLEDEDREREKVRALAQDDDNWSTTNAMGITPGIPPSGVGRGAPRVEDGHLHPLDAEREHRHRRNRGRGRGDVTLPPPPPYIPLANVVSRLVEPLDPTPINTPFVTLSTAQKYPYHHFMGSHDVREQIAQEGWSRERFWKANFELCYVDPPRSIEGQPLLLVPAHQLEELLRRVNTKLGFKDGLPFVQSELTLFEGRKDESRDEKRERKSRSRSPSSTSLIIKFSPEAPQPIYLGQLHAQADIERYKTKIADFDDADLFSTDRLSPEQVTKWHDKLQQAFTINAIRKAAMKAKKLEARKVKKQEYYASLRRLQRYLALRSRNDSEDPKALLGFVEESRHAEIEADRQRARAEVEPPVVDLTSPSRAFQFHKDVIFVAVDCEAMETRGTVTEIGLTFLDTRDLIDVAPSGSYDVQSEGDKLNLAPAWSSQIISRHIRVAEHLSYRHSHDPQMSVPEDFDPEFGISEIVPREELYRVLQRAFAIPDMDDDSDDETRPLLTNTNKKLRNIVLVGHGLSNDISYLRTLNFAVSSLPNIIDSVDTADIYNALTRPDDDLQITNLGSALLDSGMTPWNLHNAGNDARYTMELLIRLAILTLSHEKGFVKGVSGMQRRTEPQVGYDGACDPDESDGFEVPSCWVTLKLNGKVARARGGRLVEVEV